MKQATSCVLMSEPLHFAFNSEAAQSNSFQKQSHLSEVALREVALKEFYQSVETLRSFGVEVIVLKGDPAIEVPDAVFPNNWFSTHSSGEFIVYPMAVPNRRAERRVEVVQKLTGTENYHLIDLTHFEVDDSPQFLEGTGSLIFDHTSKLVYAAISPRTSEELVCRVAALLNYEPICFRSYGKSGELIYHTNVMMCVGETFVVIGKDTVATEDWSRVEGAIQQSGKEMILLSNEQVYHHFAGNMLQVANKMEQSLLFMSTSARKSLTEDQLSTLSRHNDYIVALDIPTIEHVGGGSARCMLAEIWK